MKAKILTTLLGLAILAVPAAVPASQPGDVKVMDLTPAVATTATLAGFSTLIVDPARSASLSIELPTRYTTLEWINQDPFVL